MPGKIINIPMGTFCCQSNIVMGSARANIVDQSIAFTRLFTLFRSSGNK
jgi:hypothetical protein